MKIDIFCSSIYIIVILITRDSLGYKCQYFLSAHQKKIYFRIIKC